MRNPLNYANETDVPADKEAMQKQRFAFIQISLCRALVSDSTE